MSINTPREAKGSPLPFIIVVLLIGVGGYFGWQMYQRHRSARMEYKRRIVQQPTKTAKATKTVPTNTVVEVEQEPVEAPKPREKTPEEILAEEIAARKAVLAEIAETRKNPNAKPLTRFGGIVFGEPLKGEPVRWGTVLDEDSGLSLETRGATYSVWGPQLKKPILTFGMQPLVWVTPKTRKAYGVEFSRPLKLKPGAKHDPETEKTLDFLKKQPIFKDCKVFTTVPQRPDRAGCEYVMPLGSSTVTVGEYGNELRFSVEQGDVKQTAKTEADAVREEKRADLGADKALDSKRFPHGDEGRYPRMKFKDGTPPSFCGVRFGHVAAASATLVNTSKGEKGFYLNYHKGKCPVFRGFDSGIADTDRYRGGVFAVRLYSPGGTEGLDDGDYYQNVRQTLERHYQVRPTEKPAEGLPFPHLTYIVGDVTITFGPEANGGFYLNARHEVLTALAAEAPGEKKKSRK